jgi:isoquinoline 1-oxidoreductase beta subunit
MSDPAPSHLDRRSFLIGGAVIAGSLYVGLRLAENRFDKPGSGQVFAPNAFLRITPDDKVTVIIGKSEMGQGIYTGLAMAVAEELDIDPKRVTVEFAPADPAFNAPFAPVQFTGGSMSTSTTYMPLRSFGTWASRTSGSMRP